jgi:hypothetical protein
VINCTTASDYHRKVHGLEAIEIYRTKSTKLSPDTPPQHEED